MRALNCVYLSYVGPGDWLNRRERETATILPREIPDIETCAE